jgi:hypothetical protein
MTRIDESTLRRQEPVGHMPAAIDSVPAYARHFPAAFPREVVPE